MAKILLFMTFFFCQSAFATTMKAYPNLPKFEGIDLAGGMTVHLVQGKSQNVSVSGPIDQLDCLKVNVEGETLKISPSGKGWLFGLFGECDTDDISVKISAKKILEINAAGAVELVVENLNSDFLALDLAGSVKAQLSGVVHTFVLDAAGSADVDAFELQTKTIKIASAGSVDAKINVKEALSINVAGNGSVVYKGEPQDVQSNVTGSASVRRF